MDLLRLYPSSLFLSIRNSSLLISVFFSTVLYLSNAFILNGSVLNDNYSMTEKNFSYQTCYQCSNYAVGQDKNFTSCFQEDATACVGMYCFNALDNLERTYPFRYFSGCLNLTEPIGIGPGSGVCYKGANMTKCICTTNNCNSIHGGRGLFCTNVDFLPDVDFNLNLKTVLGANNSRSYGSDIVPKYTRLTNSTLAIYGIYDICDDAFFTSGNSTNSTQRDDRSTTTTTLPPSSQSTTEPDAQSPLRGNCLTVVLLLFLCMLMKI